MRILELLLIFPRNSETYYCWSIDGKRMIINDVVSNFNNFFVKKLHFKINLIMYLYTFLSMRYFGIKINLNGEVFCLSILILKL